MKTSGYRLIIDTWRIKEAERSHYMLSLLTLYSSKSHSSLAATQKCPSHKVTEVLHGRGTQSVHTLTPHSMLSSETHDMCYLEQITSFQTLASSTIIWKNHQTFLIDLFWAWDKTPHLKTPNTALGPSTYSSSFMNSMNAFSLYCDWRRIWDFLRNLFDFSTADGSPSPCLSFLIHNVHNNIFSSCYLCFFLTF